MPELTGFAANGGSDFKDKVAAEAFAAEYDALIQKYRAEMLVNEHGRYVVQFDSGAKVVPSNFSGNQR